MTLADFLRKMIGKRVVNEPKQIEEKVAFYELGEWAGNKEKEINDKERKILVLIKDRLNLLITELDEKVKVLESINFESKKVEDTIKLIVRENLNNYLGHVKRLIENIDNLNGVTLDKFIISINRIFLEFDKKSQANYQKATFLVGNEIADIKRAIFDFSEYLISILDKNKDTITASKIISFVQLKINRINETNDIINKINERIKLLSEKIKTLKEREKQLLNEIEKIKESKSYAENLKKQEDINAEEEELRQELHKLKQLIDFKVLGNIFHVSETKIGIVKAHEEKFETAFQSDDGTSIVSLLDEAKLNNEAIVSKIRQINDKKGSILKSKSRIRGNETEDLLAESNVLKSEIKKLCNETDKELKRCRKVKLNRENIIISIKEELAKINVTVRNT